MADPELLDIRPYMFDTLIYLVGVHAQVSSAAPSLLDRALGALVDDLAEECLGCFRQVRRFGMGGMLRVGRLLPVERCTLILDWTGDTGDRIHAPNTLTTCWADG